MTITLLGTIDLKPMNKVIGILCLLFFACVSVIRLRYLEPLGMLSFMMFLLLEKIASFQEL